LGYTFTSGATQAWISDEIGEDEANKLFIRATQIGLFASLIGMGLATLVGANNVALPLQFGALGVILIGITLAVIMPETGFHPTPREDRTTWGHMWHTFKQGVDTVRAKPRLMNIVFIGLFYGIYSEGFRQAVGQAPARHVRTADPIRGQRGRILRCAARGWHPAYDRCRPICGEARGFVQSACGWAGSAGCHRDFSWRCLALRSRHTSSWR
jgi:hypothetical protein